MYRALIKWVSGSQRDSDDSSNEDDSKNNLSQGVTDKCATKNGHDVLQESTGSVTFVQDNSGMIDDKIYFKSANMTGIEIGSTVTYSFYNRDGKIKVNEILHREKPGNSGPVTTEQIISGKVTEAKRNQITVDTFMENVHVNLSEVEIDFYPIVGDQLQLTCVVNSNGEVVRAKKIVPARSFSNTGTISEYNEDQQSGIINKNIYFQFDAITTESSELKRNANVNFEAIQSAQGACEWRAIKITLIECTSVSGRYSTNSSGDNNEEQCDPALLENKHGVNVSDDCFVKANKIGDKRVFTINVSNKNTVPITIISVEFKSKKSQLCLKKPSMDEGIEIQPQRNIAFTLGFEAKFSGSARELFVIKFQGFQIGRWINIQVRSSLPAINTDSKYTIQNANSKEYKQDNLDIVNENKPYHNYNNNHQNHNNNHGNSFHNNHHHHHHYHNQHHHQQNQQQNQHHQQQQQQRLPGTSQMSGNFDRQKVSGQRPQMPMSLLTVKIPIYHVPERIDSLITRQLKNNKPIHIIPPRIISNSLLNDLCIQNYRERFHTLMFLEEMALKVSLKQYEMQRVTFTQTDDYLTMEVPFLMERRPSVIIGDSVTASKANSPNGEMYEGFVHKTGAKSVLLKFAPTFHQNYRGETYRVQFHMSRSSFRKAHHATELAYNNLGKTFLFPMAVPKKPALLEFICDDFNVDDFHLSHFNSSFNASSSLSSTASSTKTTTNPVKNTTSKCTSRYMKLASASTKSTIIPPTAAPSNDKKLVWFNDKLNRYQKMGVINILRAEARPLPYLVFGPPGTGKTVTLIECMLQILRLMPSSRLLVCAPSNSAADLIALRLIDSGLTTNDLVRMVAYNRVLESTMPERLIPYCVTGDSAGDDAQGSALHNDISRHKITVVTCMMAATLYSMGTSKNQFTHVIIDEAGQVSEPEIMIPLSIFDPDSAQVILAGDPLQLGPFVYSVLAKRFDYGRSFFERLIEKYPYVRDPVGFPDTGGYDPRLVTRLVYNYRSLPEILHLPNKLFYNSELIPVVSSDSGDEVNVLRQLRSYLPANAGKNFPPSVIFHAVRGQNLQTIDSPSWFNPVEATQVFTYVTNFYRAGINSDQIGIITPYLKQCQQIRQSFSEARMQIPKVGSVEDFQGREYQIIIVSMVRSVEEEVKQDARHGLGFIFSPPRLNVAITRARALLIIIGNPNLLCLDHKWRTLLLYAKQIGGFTGTCEFPDIQDFNPTT